MEWRFAMEQIGRELGKIYRWPKRLPRRLRALVGPFVSSISNKGTHQKCKRFAVWGPTERSAHMATDQISFYDESLKKQIEGSFISDGKSIHVSSVYGVKSIPYGDLGASIDHDAQVLLVQKLLSELARDPGSGKFKDLQQQKDDQQGQPMQKPYLGGQAGWGSSGGSGTNP
jgi:hypothetical protein